MPTHATAQLIGGRTHQCDATATYASGGARAYALLDGIYDTPAVRDWTVKTARWLARTASAQASAEGGLRTVHTILARERHPLGGLAYDEPCAVAVVAVAAPGKPLQVSWCGDARAYLLPADGGELRRLTTDHNYRQQLLDAGLVPGPNARHSVTSHLGDVSEDPAIGSVTVREAGRLLLASDGLYEPLEDSCRDMRAYLGRSPRWAARALVQAAIDHGSLRPDNASALVVDLTE